MEEIMAGEMRMSLIWWVELGGRRDGKVGRILLSVVKTDLKYVLRRLALSASEVRRLPLESVRGGMPVGELSFELINL
jgi:hypothetical protein